MAFWQENYAFIKDVYDSRSQKMLEVMTKTEEAIAEVLADKIYTSADFAKVKDNFMGLAKNLENTEVKDWLESTKETLMSDRDSKAKGDEEQKLQELMTRYTNLLPKVGETKVKTDSLWKAYQFTDEMAPLMEWLVEKKTMATRDINSNSAGETEELIEKQEKVIDTLDKKRKAIMAMLEKGQKLKDDPKSPAFLIREVNRMKETWDETNNLALDRLNRLRDNMSAWERYENKRNELFDKLASAEAELTNIKKVYDMAAGPEDVKKRTKEAASIRKNLEDLYKTVDQANEIVQTLLTDDMKAELNDQVTELKTKLEVNGQIDEKIKQMDEFNGKLKLYEGVLQEMEKWLVDGRKRMDDLLNPAAPIEAEERVLNTMELCEDIRQQIEQHEKQQELWNNELAPTESGEDTPDCQAIVSRMSQVQDTQAALNSEAETESAKFGEDVKHLADWQNALKKFTPWIEKTEVKMKSGAGKPSNLEEAKSMMEACKKFKEDCATMKTLIDEGYASACKMTNHAEPDKMIAIFTKRWEVAAKTAASWITTIEGLVTMWEKQAETADKVTAAISAPASNDMKLEDLEGHLNALKQMFIEKQKMVDSMNAQQAA